MDVLSIVWNVLLSGGVISVGIGAHWVWRQIQPTASKYFEEKAKNLANKQDLADLTHAVKKVEAEFNEKLESIKAEHQKELAGYNARLEQAKHISRVQFEKEFLIYGQVWNELVIYQTAVLKLYSPNDQHFPLTEEVTKKRNERYDISYQKFAAVVHSNKPFYASEVYSLLRQILDIGQKERVTAVMVKAKLSFDKFLPTSNQSFWNQKLLQNEELNRLVEEVCEAIRNRISSVEIQG
jgi:hypothetical protein